MSKNDENRLERFFAGDMDSHEREQLDKDIQREQDLAADVAKQIAMDHALEEMSKSQSKKRMIQNYYKKKKRRRFFTWIGFGVIAIGLCLYFLILDKPDISKNDLLIDNTDKNNETPSETPVDSNGQVIDRKNESTDTIKVVVPPTPPVTTPGKDPIPPPVAAVLEGFLEKNFFLIAYAGGNDPMVELHKIVSIFESGRPNSYDSTLLIVPSLLKELKNVEKRALAGLMQGIAFWKTGKQAEAIAVLEPISGGGTNCCYLTAKWWLIVIYVESGELLKAEPLLDQIIDFEQAYHREKAIEIRNFLNQ